jgi:hypothetical protein
MSSGEIGDRSDDVQASLSTRHGVGALLISGLTVVIIGIVVFLDVFLTDHKILGRESVFHWILMAILVGASLLPILGIKWARRGILSRTEPKAASIGGLITNAVIFLGAVLCDIWVIWFYFLMAKIEGSFLINDEPAKEMEIYLLDADTRWKSDLLLPEKMVLIRCLVSSLERTLYTLPVTFHRQQRVLALTRNSSLKSRTHLRIHI